MNSAEEDWRLKYLAGEAKDIRRALETELEWVQRLARMGYTNHVIADKTGIPYRRTAELLRNYRGKLRKRSND
jgi:hypothetical protein